MDSNNFRQEGIFENYLAPRSGTGDAVLTLELPDQKPWILRWKTEILCEKLEVLVQKHKISCQKYRILAQKHQILRQKR